MHVLMRLVFMLDCLGIAEVYVESERYNGRAELERINNLCVYIRCKGLNFI